MYNQPSPDPIQTVGNFVENDSSGGSTGKEENQNEWNQNSIEIWEKKNSWAEQRAIALRSARRVKVDLELNVFERERIATPFSFSFLF